MSKRIQYWGWAVAWTVLIYSTLYIARPICEYLRKHTPFETLIWGIFGLISLWVVYLIVKHVRFKSVSSVVLFCATVVGYGVALFWLKIPEERIHLIQYGVLVCLVVRALRLDLKPVIAYPTAVVVTSLLGWGDEGIQYLLPNRYFDWKDVLLNAISAVLGLMLWLSFQKGSTQS